MTYATISAIAEPNRFNIMELLRDYGELTVSEIAQKLRLKLPQSSKHLHVLAEAGLVQVQIDANRRIYSLCPTPLVEMNNWLGTFTTRTKLEQLERFDQQLKKIQNIEKFPNND